MHDKEYYKKLGFKCGLEIHQRLATRQKLFCSCSAEITGDENIGQVSRRQRAVVGELGAMDRSTSFESSRKRKFIYNIFRNTSCLVDIDEEPPHKVNRDAIEIALRFASAFGSKVPDEIEPMRKEVVDGSDTSAFQRSMMVAYDGKIEANGRHIPITSVFLEEESSGIESNSNDSVVYNIDRQGIPLIEIDTDPSISTPQEAKEVALKIGMILRLTGRRDGKAVASEVQRGIGTIRQDVNVSIAGGTRVEVKGLQEIGSVDLLIENEVERQIRLIEIKKELVARQAKVDGSSVDLSKILGSVSGNIIGDTLSKGGVVLGSRLQGFAGILGMEISQDRRLGSEISDYAKMAGVKGIIHSDEDLSKYGIGDSEIRMIRSELVVNDLDSFILIAADKDACTMAMSFALDRARMALTEVPPETRAVSDSKKGTTRFMRPLPGGSRMYPETDSEPILISRQYYDGIQKQTVYMEDRLVAIRKEISNQQLAEQMAYSVRLPLYEYITSNVSGINIVVAATLLEKIKELERSGISVDIDKDVMVHLFKAYAAGEITKAAIGEVMKNSPKSINDTDRIISEKSLARISGERLKELILKEKKASKGDLAKELMSKYRLNVDGDEFNVILGDMK
ncbi:MAG: Glu-tRNA(Gln) amidotransferase subunit GatE [Candidatus Micrarchaeaceae archaeon]